MTHEETETLSALIDNELDAQERGRVQAHLDACDLCRKRVSSLETLTMALAELPQVGPNAEERRAINQAVAGAMSRRPVWSFARLAWALGAVSVVAIGAVVASQMITREEPTAGLALRDESARSPLQLNSAEEVRMAVIDDPNVREQAHEYLVSDVGRLQSKMIESYDLGPSAEDTATRETTGAFSQQRVPAASSSIQPKSSCMRSILRMQEYPMLPVLARAITYQATDSWLLVFVYSNETRDDARLDRLQIWVVKRSDCTIIQHIFQSRL